MPIKQLMAISARFRLFASVLYHFGEWYAWPHDAGEPIRNSLGSVILYLKQLENILARLLHCAAVIKVHSGELCEHVGPRMLDPSKPTHDSYYKAVPLHVGESLEPSEVALRPVDSSSDGPVGVPVDGPGDMSETAEAAEDTGSFRCFPNLPREVQILIWEAAADVPCCQTILDIMNIGYDHTRRSSCTSVAWPSNAGRKVARLWYHGDDLGLWTACRMSRAVMEHLYADAQRRSVPGFHDGKQVHPGEPIETFMCRLHRVHAGLSSFHTAALDFKQVVRQLDAMVRHVCIAAEYHTRKYQYEELIRVAATATAEDGTEVPKPCENLFAQLLRIMYEIDDDLPQSPDDGPIPLTFLKRLVPELRMGRLLGVRWA